MPIVRLVKRFVSVPDTWEGWVMRVMTVAVVITLSMCLILLQKTAELSQQITNGRAERNAFQTEQSERTCSILRAVTKDPIMVGMARC